MSVPFLSPPSNEAPKDVLRRGQQGPVPDGFDTAEVWLRAWFDPLEFSLKDEEIYVRFPMFCSPHGLNNTGAELWRLRIKIRERMRARHHGTLSGVPSRDDSPSSLAARREAEAAARPKTLSPPRSSAFEGFFLRRQKSVHFEYFEGTAEGTRVYTPLLLRGAPGTGKTHLLRAAAQTLEKQAKYYFLARRISPLCSATRGGTKPDAPCFPARPYAWTTCIFWPNASNLRKNWPPSSTIWPKGGVPYCVRQWFLLKVPVPIPVYEDRDPVTELTPGLLSRLCMGMVLELAEPDLDVRLRDAQARLAEYGLDTGKDMALLLARRCGGLLTAARRHSPHRRLPRSKRTVAGRKRYWIPYCAPLGNPRALTPDAVLGPGGLSLRVYLERPARPQTGPEVGPRPPDRHVPVSRTARRV